MSLVKYGKMAVRKYPAVRKRYKVYAPAVRQLASDVMYLKGLINSEPHAFTLQASNNYDWTGVIVSCCNIAVGDTDATRTGNRILPRYFSLNVHMNANLNVAAPDHVTHRFIIFRWWGDAINVAGSPTIAEVLGSSASGTAFAPVCHLNPNSTGPKGDRQRRIEVLRSEMFTLDKVSDTSKCLKFNIEMNGKGKKQKEHIEYCDALPQAPQSGGIFVLFITDSTGANLPSYVMESRLVYYDN